MVARLYFGITSSSNKRASDMEHIRPVILSKQVSDIVREERVWRKLDIFLIPIMGMIYLLSFLVSLVTSQELDS
jgi:uncharacterized membrane protein